MKRLFLILLSFISVVVAEAQLNGSGYYRIQNYGSKRYIYVCDGTSAGINMSTTSVDMGAVQTWKDLNKALTDPASIIYIQQAGDKWDLMSQGTSVHSLIGYYVDIDDTYSAQNIYQVSATVSGQTLYLYDGETSSSPRGRLVTGSASGSLEPKYRRWQIFGLNQTDNYIGIAPEISNGGKYYAPYYVSFPFTFYSSGMKAYYVKKVDAQKKVAVIKEITGVVPSSTPIIVECSANTAQNNKLKLETYNGYNNRPSDNALEGVYFSNQYRESPVAYRVYDSKTMRVLGTTSSGKLGFVTATNAMLHNCGDSDGEIWCLNANQSYLQVEDGTASELTIVTEAEYEELCNVSVSSVTLDKTSVISHVGETVQITATVLPDDAVNKSLTWTSSNESVATVVNGLVTMKSLGNTTITATTTDGTNISASCSVAVEPIIAEGITVNPASIELVLGESASINYTITPDNTTSKEVVWSSSNTNVATVENGVITSVGVGEADITVKTTDGSNLSATCKITVSPVLAESISLDRTLIVAKEGEVIQLTATVLPTNTTNAAVVWSTDNQDVATVDENGLVTVKEAGQAVITVTTTDGSNLSAQCIVTSEAILVETLTLNCESVSLTDEMPTFQLVATITPDNATCKTLVWSSSDDTVVTVDTEGFLTLVGNGDAVITVRSTDGSDLAATCLVNVTSGIISVTANNTDVRYFTTSGIKMQTLKRGLNIVVMPDGTVRKVMLK